MALFAFVAATAVLLCPSSAQATTSGLVASFDFDGDLRHLPHLAALDDDDIAAARAAQARCTEPASRS